MVHEYDYIKTYNILREALADRNTPADQVHLISIPGGRTWALKEHQADEALELAKRLLLHPRIDTGVTPIDFMGGISNAEFPYFSQVTEPLVAISIALKEKYIYHDVIRNRYFANATNPFVKEYVEDMQGRSINSDNDKPIN